MQGLRPHLTGASNHSSWQDQQGQLETTSLDHAAQAAQGQPQAPGQGTTLVLRQPLADTSDTPGGSPFLEANISGRLSPFGRNLQAECLGIKSSSVLEHSISDSRDAPDQQKQITVT